MNQKPIKNFSALRKLFWPIHAHERKKFLLLNFMMFFILFNYTILRNIKDTLVIVASGAEIIPFIKAFVMLPSSILVVAIYSKLSNIFSQRKIFYIILSTFLGFYALYALFIFPNKELLQMSNEQLQHLQFKYPNFQYIFALIANWTSVLFYLFAELWGATILGLMFWQFANEVTKTHEATRFYSMFNVIGNSALVIAGCLGSCLCKIGSNVSENNSMSLLQPQGNKLQKWGMILNYEILIVVAVGVIIYILHFFAYRHSVEKTVKNSKKLPILQEKKQQHSIKEGFKEIIQSKYLRCIAMIVVGYGLSINVLSIIWKKQLSLLFVNELDYSSAVFSFFGYVGIASLTIAFCFKGVISKFGWYKSAMITPIVVLITAIIFFMLILLEDANLASQWLNLNGLVLIVVIGGIQQILSKGFKYSILDPTKEMAYIPLSKGLKRKGKAAVDITCYSLAKAGGGYIIGGLLILTAASDLMLLVPYLSIVILCVIIAWIFAVKKLNILYHQQLQKNPDDCS